MRRTIDLAFTSLLCLAVACGDDSSGTAPDAAPGADAAGGGADASSAENRAPVADAGQDIAVDVGNLVLLSGMASSDPDGDSLSYSWRFVSIPNGSTASLLNADAQGPSFVADRAGNYIIELVVSDGTVESDPDQVIVAATLASGTNLPPIADAGADQQAVTGQTLVQLDGTGSSDPEGASLNYLWVRKTFPAGSTASLNTNTPSNPTFVPDRDGEYVFRLQVNDGVTVSTIDEVSIFADSQDQIAIIDGSGQSGTVGTDVQPIVAQVVNEFDLPVQSVQVRFAVTAGDGSVSSTFAFTDSNGKAQTTLTLGTTAGVNTVVATCSSCATTTTDSVSATGDPDVPASVLIDDPVDVSVGQTMQVRAKIVDQYGNLVDTDSSTQFTLQVAATGAAAFTTASQGAIVSGGGTSSVLVTVQNGEVVVGVTDDTAETVGFTAVDTEGNGLTYLGTRFDETSSTQTLGCSGGSNSFSFDLSSLGAPTSDATIEVTAIGDLNAFFEIQTVFLEDQAGTSYGAVFDDVGGSCTESTDSVTVPLADLATYDADGTIDMELVTDFSVSCSCAENTVKVRLTVHAGAAGTFN